MIPQPPSIFATRARLPRIYWICTVTMLTSVSLVAAWAGTRQSEPTRDADVIVVGAGIAGISAALEGAHLGSNILVVDMASVFGGHAVMSEGAVSIVGSPLQRSLRIADTPDLAYADFVRWGEDADEAWVRYYVEHSVDEIYEWVTSMGVQFTDVLPRPGNTVPRYHLSKGRGLGLVAPLFDRHFEIPLSVSCGTTRSPSCSCTVEESQV
jgi:predicted oxidoreductase